MQEVTIRPRSTFRHFITVEESGKELCWNFCTRKKNISFGLFRQRDAIFVEATGKYVLASGGFTEVGRNYTLLSNQQSGANTPVAATLNPKSPVANAIPLKEGTNGPSNSLGSVPNGTSSSNTSLVAGDLLRASLTSDRVSLVSPAVSSPVSRSTTMKSMDELNLVELLPIAHYESCKVTVKGSYYIHEPGTYVLVFDNSFSVNTSKKLFFFVALKDITAHAPPIHAQKAVEGYMMKKGNRAMQGYQRRWVEVMSNGVLNYYKSQGSEMRGTVNLRTAAIRLDHDNFLIDIDSGQSLFHFKVDNATEFEKWTTAIETFAAASALDIPVDPMGSEPSISSTPNAANNSNLSLNMTNSFGNENELDSVQDQLNSIMSSLSAEILRLRDFVETSKTRVDSKTSWKDLVLVLSSVGDATSSMSTQVTKATRKLTIFSSNLRIQREKALSQLAQTELAFFACLNDNNRVRRKFGLEAKDQAEFLPAGMTRLGGEHERVASIASTKEEFYDAEEGEESGDSSSDEYEYAVASSNGDMLNQGQLSSSTGDSGSAIDVPRESLRRESSVVVSNITSNDPGPKITVDPASPVNETTLLVTRRTKLPAPTCSMQNISLMSILRNNVGKDLSTVAMPIALNEPINLLQKLCEELEYSELLDKANQTADPVDRLCLIAAFIVSGYSSTIHRAARKPFNPLLGETYELSRPDKGFKYISEKVSHHPPIMACYAESRNFTFYQDSMLKSKFWGKSMELNNTGIVHVELPTAEDHYTWTKLTTSMRNIFSSARYLEHYGTCKIISQVTGHYCELNFKESGYFSSSKNEIVGGVFFPSGQKAVSLSGQWDHSLCKFKDESPQQLEVIWKANLFPPNYLDNYGFTKFAIELNEMTPDLIGMLPNTDTRYRPDQLMYEKGSVDEAEVEKQRLEQKQREFRKELEAQGKKWNPQWFEKKSDRFSESGESWQYSGRYWERKGKFEQVIDLFS